MGSGMYNNAVKGEDSLTLRSGIQLLMQPFALITENTRLPA
jgi:hypothetical protein